MIDKSVEMVYFMDMNIAGEQKKFTILLVEDDIDLSLIEKTILMEEGYNVVTAATGADALGLLEVYKIDLVVLDLNLPDINGEALLGKMKKIKPKIKVIIMTGQEDIDSYIHTLQLGAIDYLIKPVSPNGLTGVLKKILT